MPTVARCSRPLLLSLGEPAGIGPDCVLRAHQADPGLFHDIRIIGPARWLRDRANDIGLSVAIEEVASLEAQSAPGALACWNPGIGDVHAVRPGNPKAGNADAIITCLRKAAAACMLGEARALITGPIEKAVLKNAGFGFPGHTEYLAHLAGTEQVVMMLAAEALKVALLTTHLPLKDVPAHLSLSGTLACLRITHQDMQQKFRIPHPRIALSALNPHAGEGGHFGREESELLAPAIRQARAEGMDVSGPWPADTLFSPAMRGSFDVAICCYHDQALIPIKALYFGQAVNATLGLPFVRTSVDHGTALDRAGTAQVSFASLVAAIKMAQHMSNHAIT